MNQRQLQYAVLLAETGNFSLLAQQLNITQPALSKQVLALENELGVRLFDRSTNPVTLTAAGECFIREARALLESQQRLQYAMEQFRDGQRSRLVIGATPFRSAYILPKLVKRLREQHPGVQVEVIEEGSSLLRKDAAEGRFDLAVINLPVDETVLDATPIEPDRLVLVVPNDLLPEYLKGKNKVEFKECRDLPFAVVGKNQEMRILFEKLCAINGVSPPIATQVVGLTTAWEMACSGVAATLLPVQFVNEKLPGQAVTVLELVNAVYLRQSAVVTKKGQYISPLIRHAIELLTKQQSNT